MRRVRVGVVSSKKPVFLNILFILVWDFGNRERKGREWEGLTRKVRRGILCWLFAGVLRGRRE